jgi:hypothetical protein
MDSGIDRAINKAWNALASKGVKRHVHGRRCINLLRHVLHADEGTLLESRQSYLVDIAPTRIIATRRRLIIIDPSFWGLYTGHDISDSTHYVIIPYKHIIGVTMSKGLLFASLKIHTIGGEETNTLMKGENEIHGMIRGDAVNLASFIEEIVEYEDEAEEEVKPPKKVEERSYSFHRDALSEGTPFEQARALVESGGAKFVWLGVEPIEDVEKLFRVSKGMVIQMSGTHLLKHSKEEIAKMGSLVLVSYEGVMAHHTSTLMRKKFGVQPLVLQGGIVAVARYQKGGVEEFLS